MGDAARATCPQGGGLMVRTAALYPATMQSACALEKPGFSALNLLFHLEPLRGNPVSSFYEVSQCPGKCS
jgi:hypothetical protein